VSFPAPPLAPRPSPARGLHAWLAAGFLLFAVYGSLVPFHYRPLPLEEAQARFQAVCQQPIRVVSRSDWLANILLFIPLGYLLTAALGAGRPLAIRVAAAAVVVLFCGAASTAIEFTQLYFPPRDSSLNDIVAESLGALLGAATWLTAGQAVTDWTRRVWAGVGPRGALAWAFPAYVAALLVVQLLPLDLTLSPADLYHKYREGRVRLLPWGATHGQGLETVARDLTNLAYFLPFGLLLACLPARRWREVRAWPRVLGLGVAFAAAVEGLQLFVYSRGCDATDVVIGGLGALAGWGMALTLCPAPAGPAGGMKVQGAARLVFLVGWVVLLAFLAWQPFDFRASLGLASRRLREMSLMPFVDYYRGNYLNALDQVVLKVLLFLPVGALLSWCGRSGAPALAGLWRLLPMALGLAALLEAGQALLPTRYPSLTDVLVEGLGACVGFVLAHQVRLAFRADRPAPAAARGPLLAGPNWRFSVRGPAPL
jgi:VanZ family protein